MLYISDTINLPWWNTSYNTFKLTHFFSKNIMLVDRSVISRTEQSY